MNVIYFCTEMKLHCKSNRQVIVCVSVFSGQSVVWSLFLMKGCVSERMYCMVWRTKLILSERFEAQVLGKLILLPDKHHIWLVQ